MVIIDLDVSGGANLVPLRHLGPYHWGGFWVNLDAVSPSFRSLGAYDRPLQIGL